MIITAKFASVCPCCSKSIAVGSKVEWSKGSKARHATCTGPAVASAAPRSQYRRIRYAVSEAQRNYDRGAGYYSSGLYDEES